MANGRDGKDYKRVRERVASVLPFRVLEAAEGKPMRISGVAITAGLSRNLNFYSAEELQAFAPKLVGAPLYIEHVAVSNSIGKVTNAEYDPASRCLVYEAEVYDQVIADKIRNGLIQHVSVGADYDALDVVDAKVPHGLHNAELSLVAVPGIPEANIQVLERLREFLASGGHGKVKLAVKELLEPLQCVFCDGPGEFLISVCGPCGDKADGAVNGHLPAAGPAGQVAQSGVESLKEEELKKLVEYGVKEGLRKAGVTEAEWDAEYINNLPDDAFAYIELGGQKDDQGKTVPRSLRHLPYKNDQGSLDADHVRNALARLDQTEISAEAKAQALKKLCSAAGELKIESAVCNLDSTAERLRAKLTETEGKLTETVDRLNEANKTVEKLKQLVPGVDLLANPPKMMPVSEVLQMVKEVLPAPMVQRSWSLGAQRLCQDVRRVVLKLEERL